MAIFFIVAIYYTRTGSKQVFAKVDVVDGVGDGEDDDGEDDEDEDKDEDEDDDGVVVSNTVFLLML